MKKLIKNNWRHKSKDTYVCAQILRHEIHPEGLDVERIRFFDNGCLILNSCLGHIISVLRGRGRLQLEGTNKQTLHLQAGVHFYLPPDFEGVLNAEVGAEFLHISSPSESQARGRNILLRDETFLAACTSRSQSLRWVLTPQYLSRRIFLFHDQTLLSKSGNPVSLYHTTMFDVKGLPINEDGESVFKMSYNSKTEVNFCYEVKGTARVRMARHPYRKTKQLWEPWLALDGDSTYHLNETAGGREEECRFNALTQITQTFRNKHEVYINDGYVSLFCLFDPAPTGIERHLPGEYSDYEPLSSLLGTESYESYAREVKKYDEMMDRLSMEKAKDELNIHRQTHSWELYLRGLESQVAIETDLAKCLQADGEGRERILARWLQTIPNQMGCKNSPEKGRRG